LLISLVLAGCDGRGLAALDAGAADALLADVPPVLVDGRPAEVPLPPPACTPGADQTCNADPTTSAISGHCTSLATCMCLAGFSYDSGTRRCRPERSCPTLTGEAPTSASGPPLCRPPCPGEWTITMPLDTSDCAARPVVDCPGPYHDFAGLLLDLAQTCRVRSYLFVRVDFEMGCPTRLLLRPVAGGTWDLPTECLAAALTGRRWQCALDASCSIHEHDTLP
jgi:hypothetical protein